MSYKALVTGGAGFIGSHIVDELVKGGHDVRVFDSLDPQVHGKGAKKPGYLNPKAEFVKGDVTDKGALAKALEDIEVVFHEAAAVGVGQSMYQISYYVSNNNVGTSNLLELLADGKHGVKKMLVAASMSSYGEGAYSCQGCGTVYPPLRTAEQMEKRDWELHCPNCGKAAKPIPTPETKPQHCNSIYALTKKDQEEMLLMIGKTYGIPAVALRYFNVYGPRQSLSNPYTGVAAIFMSRIKNGNRPIVYEDGLQTRDFISVHDIARANVLAMEKSAADYEVFNVGSGIPHPIKSIAEMIARTFGSKIAPEITNTFRKGDVRHCYADTSKIKKKLGFTPSVSFEAGMCELIEWSRKAEAVDKFESAQKELSARGLV